MNWDELMWRLRHGDPPMSQWVLWAIIFGALAVLTLAVVFGGSQR